MNNVIIKLTPIQNAKLAPADICRLKLDINANGVKLGDEKDVDTHVASCFISLAKGKEQDDGQPTYWLRTPYNSSTKRKLVDLDKELTAQILAELEPYIDGDQFLTQEAITMEVEMPELSPWVYVNPLKAATPKKLAMANVVIKGIMTISGCCLNTGEDGAWLGMPYWLTADGKLINHVNIYKGALADQVQRGARAGYKKATLPAAADAPAEATE